MEIDKLKNQINEKNERNQTNQINQKCQMSRADPNIVDSALMQRVKEALLKTLEIG